MSGQNIQIEFQADDAKLLNEFFGLSERPPLGYETFIEGGAKIRNFTPATYGLDEAQLIITVSLNLLQGATASLIAAYLYDKLKNRVNRDRVKIDGKDVNINIDELAEKIASKLSTNKK